MDNIHIKIGQNVAKYRKDAGLSQLALSLKLNHTSVSIVSSAERYYRKRHFNIEHLFQIAKILEIDVCQLLRIET
jgi:ribosome-binding protein aMBF1 (putative translation factor)